MSIELGETLNPPSTPFGTMNDTQTLAVVTTLTATIIKFVLVTQDKGDGEKTYLTMLDGNDSSFPGHEVPVASEAYIEVINDSGCFLAIFLQKDGAGVSDTPFKQNIRLVRLDPGDGLRRKQVKKVNKERQFDFTAVALSSAGDLIHYDPRIIIKPQ